MWRLRDVGYRGRQATRFIQLLFQLQSHRGR
jgi:hypothetical protein